MNITVDWYNDQKTIIYYKFKIGWTFQEFRNVYQDVYNMLDTVDHTVDAIVDLTEARIFPKDTLTEMRRLTFEQHENGGITVIITESAMSHTMYNFLKSVHKRFSEVFHLAKTLDKALYILDEPETSNTRIQLGE